MGNYSETYPIRLDRSDMIVWLDLPRAVYFRRVLGRIFGNYGKVRSDAAPDCAERLDFEFLRFVWRYPTKSRAKVQNALAGYIEGRRFEHLTQQQAVAAFVARMTSSV